MTEHLFTKTWLKNVRSLIPVPENTSMSGIITVYSISTSIYILVQLWYSGNSALLLDQVSKKKNLPQPQIIMLLREPSIILFGTFYNFSSGKLEQYDFRADLIFPHDGGLNL